MVWLGGLQIKGNDLHICGTPAKCINELIVWHCVNQSIGLIILLLADMLATLDLAAVVNYRIA